MPDHYRDIFQHAPLFAVGMVIGQIDSMLVSVPTVIKLLAGAAVFFSAFYSLKADVQHVHEMQAACYAEHTRIYQAISSNQGRIDSYLLPRQMTPQQFP